ncbi:glycoside hydrolase family 5 protein [Ideonella sp. DXS29W]|uniref:Glycoside hydrolase family 5 protein n=1 Tax=Ideonella lacteola TaxID=2984193 RepID=A0ABU9BU23_9BURK
MKRWTSSVISTLALGASIGAYAQGCGTGGGVTVCLTATGTASHVELSWTADKPITNVQILRDKDSDPDGRKRLAKVGKNVRNYVDEGAVAGKPYWYWIKFSVDGQSYDSNAAATARAGMRDMTSLQLSAKMAPGWNLGNTLEAIGGETAWGNPKANQAIMDGIKAAGFKSVRIPVSWKQYADANDNISASWMARVTEVVNYARNAGLYTIINIHWDGGWMQPTYSQQAMVNARIAKFWTQIANNFKTYDDYLLFAGTNEVMVDGDYGPPTVEYYTVQNSFNQTFVDAVRATGGYNKSRHLIVQGFNTNIDYTVAYFSVPKDPAAKKLMVEVHYYDPYNFTLNGSSDNIWQWGAIADNPAHTETWANEPYVDAQMDKMKTRFMDSLGMGVLMGEYAAISRLSVDSSQRYRTYWDETITRSAAARGIVPVYWDHGYTGGDHTMGLFDRSTGAQVHTGVISAVVNAAK